MNSEHKMASPAKWPKYIGLIALIPRYILEMSFAFLFSKQRVKIKCSYDFYSKKEKKKSGGRLH